MSAVQLCPTLCNPIDCRTPGLPVHHQVLELAQTHVQQVGNAIQSSHPLSSPSPSAPNPFHHKSFSNESNPHMRWPKYWSFSFSIIPSKEHPGLISFRMDWVDLLAVQGTLKSLLQHHSSKASILRCSALFTVQLSHPYMTTGKTIALTRRTFVGKVMSLPLYMLSRLVITFLPRSRSDQIRSVAQSCPTLCDPMNRSTPGLPVHHQLPEFTQIHVHRVSDVIQPSLPLSSPYIPAFKFPSIRVFSNESALPIR